MDIKTKALCIKALDYKDNDKLLTLATLDEGKITALAKSVKSPKSKLKLSASPLCFGEYILSRKNNRFLVIGCSIEDSFFDCWEDVHKYTASQIILEVLDKITYGSNDCKEELLLSLKAISGINYAPTYPYIIVVWFLSKIMPILGVEIASTEEIPEGVRLMLTSLYQLEVQDLDSLEIEGRELMEAFNYLNLILKNTLSIKINSIGEAFKIINS